MGVLCSMIPILWSDAIQLSSKFMARPNAKAQLLCTVTEVNTSNDSLTAGRVALKQA